MCMPLPLCSVSLHGSLGVVVSQKGSTHTVDSPQYYGIIHRYFDGRPFIVASNYELVVNIDTFTMALVAKDSTAAQCISLRGFH